MYRSVQADPQLADPCRQISLVDLFILRPTRPQVTVGHDNTGYSASWHLDHLAVTNTKTDQRFLFQCR